MMMLKKIKWRINGQINEYWNIGFVQNDLEEIVERDNVNLDVRWLKHNYSSSERWFADPFILDVSETKIYVLVEEWYAPIDKGRISKLTVDKHSFELQDIVPVLELDTHLSFPAIHRIEDRVFIHPENSKSGKHSLYEYCPKEDKCVWIRDILQEELTDTVFLNHQGEDYLFTTKGERASENILDVYNKIGEEYKYKESVVFEEKLARMAGDFFRYKDKLYRPAQECNKSYGHAVSLQEAKYYDYKWSFTEINRLYSPSKSLCEGLHTFNMYKGVIVVDAVGHHGTKFSRKVLESLRSLLS